MNERTRQIINDEYKKHQEAELKLEALTQDLLSQFKAINNRLEEFKSLESKINSLKELAAKMTKSEGIDTRISSLEQKSSEDHEKIKSIKSEFEDGIVKFRSALCPLVKTIVTDDV